MSRKTNSPNEDLFESVVAIDGVVPNPRNPRIHDEGQIEKLAESLRHFGQTKPILVRHENGMICAGEGIWQAARSLGWSEIRALRWQTDQETADRFMVADNRLADLSYHDPDRLAALIRDVREHEFGALGFEVADAQHLLGLRVGESDVRRIESGPVQDQFWISVRGPLVSQAAALSKLQSLMESVDGVEVDLGTVTG